MNTPAHQLPTISEDTVIRGKMKVSTLVAIVGAAFTGLVCFATVVIFSYVMWSDVQTLKSKAIEEAQRNTEAFRAQAEAMKAQAAALQAIKDSVQEIEFRQKYGVTTKVPSAGDPHP